MPPFWIFELLLTFAGVIFLVFAGRAIYRLMQTSVRPFNLRIAAAARTGPAGLHA